MPNLTRQPPICAAAVAMEPKSKDRKLSPLEAAASAALIAMVLGNEDILREILLRLGFTGCLVRAAAVCKQWYRVASNPGFLGRFRTLHPPRLLGFYDNARLRFVPRPHPPEVASVVRRCCSLRIGYRVDMLLDCRNGRVILSLVGDTAGKETTRRYAICSSLYPERGLTFFTWPKNPGDDEGEDDDSSHDDVDNALLRTVFDQGLLLPEDGGDGRSCTLVTLTRSARGIKAHVCDLQAGKWSQVRTSKVLVWPDLPEPLVACRNFGFLAHGKVYRICMEDHILGIDLASTSLFLVKFPVGVNLRACAANVGLSRAEVPGFKLIHVSEDFQLSVWIYRTDSSGPGNSWELVDTVCLRQAFGHLVPPAWFAGDVVFSVSDVSRDNAEFVLFEIEQQLFYLDVSKRTVEKVYHGTQSHGCPFDVCPLVMVWPPTFPELKNN